MFTVKFPYEANSQTDINLDVGDILCNVEDVGNGWSLGYNKTRGTTGTFPTSFLVKRLSSIRKSISFRPKRVDEITLSGHNPTRKESVIPRVKAKIPSDVLQRRLTKVPGHREIKLPKIVETPSMKFKDEILYSSQNEHKIIKGVLGIFGGFLACGILFVLLHFSYDYTLEISGYITLAAALPICTALAVSTLMRCVMLLMIPSLFSGKGRAVFLSMILAMLLAGPGINIAFNAKEASESMACTQELIYNQTLLLRNQLEAPIRKIEDHIRSQLKDLKKVADDIANFIKPALQVFDDFARKMDEAGRKLKDIARECEVKVENAETSCVRKINNIHSKCETELRRVDPTHHVTDFGKKVGEKGKEVVDKIGNFFKGWGKRRKRRQSMDNEEINIVDMLTEESVHAPWSTIVERRANQTSTAKHGLYRFKRFSILDKLCVVVDLSAICRVVQVGKSVGCNALRWISMTITQTSNFVKSVLQKVDDFFYFDFEGDIGNSGKMNTSKTAAEITAEVKADIESKTREILMVGKIITYILTCSIFFLFLKSCVYVKKFRSKDRFDNFYITKSFKLYDQSCKEAGKPSVLPLKKKEHHKYVDTRSISLSSKEIAASKKGLIKVTIHLLIAASIIFFDHVLYFILQLIDRYGHLNINLGGSTHLDVSVEGSGVIALFLRLFLKGVQIDTDFDVKFNLTTCIPNPKKPDDDSIYTFSILYFFAYLFVLLQAYGSRLRRKIAACFYPDIDSRRNIYLHEKIRNNRKMFLSWLKKNLPSNNKQQYMENRISLRGWLEYRNPKFAKYVCCCLPKKRICSCCSTNLKGIVKSHKCDNCHLEYCDDCYSDMNYICLVCTAGTESDQAGSDALALMFVSQ